MPNCTQFEINLRRSFTEARKCGVFLSLAACLWAGAATGAPLQQAEITRILNEVLVLKPDSQPQQAQVKEVVTGKSAVRTGAKSRAELEFADKTLTRLGANTLFSFTQGTRDMSLEEGTMLLQVPKDAGGAKIRTAAVTAAVTGTTVLVEHSQKNYAKLIVVEGTMRVYLPGRVGESILLKPGQMIILPPNAKALPAPVQVDLRKLVRTSKLFDTKAFKEIPSEKLVTDEVKTQQKKIKEGELVNTNLLLLGKGTEVVIATEEVLTAIEYASNGFFPQPLGGGGDPDPTPTVHPTVPPTPRPTPTPPPSSKYEPLPAIAGNPYIINSTTLVRTDPDITTNGKTSAGTLYNTKQQGLATKFFFGGARPFDALALINSDFAKAGDVAAYSFDSLEFQGTPLFDTTDGSRNVVFVSTGNVTSGGGPFPLDFSSLDGFVLMTRDGSITLGDNVSSITGPQKLLEFYARGSASVLTLNTPIMMPSSGGVVRLYAENSVNVLQRIDAHYIDVLAGSSFNLAGTLSADSVSIDMGGNLNVDGKFFDFGRIRSLDARSKGLTFANFFAFSSAQGASALFQAGAAGVNTSGSGFSISGNVSILSSGDIDLFGAMVDIGGPLVADGSIKLEGMATVSFLNAGGDFILGGGTSSSLTATNGAVTAKTLNNQSGGAASIVSPTQISFVNTAGVPWILDAPLITWNNSGNVGALPGLGGAVQTLQVNGNFTLDGNLNLPAVQMILGSGYSFTDVATHSVTLKGLTVQPGGSAEMGTADIYELKIGGGLKVDGNLDTSYMTVAGAFVSTGDVNLTDKMLIGGQWQSKEGGGSTNLTLGPSAIAQVAGGIDFQAGPTAPGNNGRDLFITAQGSVTLGAGGLGGAGTSSPRINLQGKDVTGPANNGGTLNVMLPSTSAGQILVDTTYITTEPGATGGGGNGGSVTLNATQSTGTASGRIQVSGSKIVTGSSSGPRPAATPGSISISSLAQNLKGIRITNSSQLQALAASAILDGNVAVTTQGAAIDVINSTIRGGDITIDTQNSGVDSAVNISNAVIQASDTLRIRAFGNGGQLTISNGSALSAATQMKLYGGFSSGKVLFTGGGTISLSSPTIHIAGNTVEISNGTSVNNSGTTNVYANGPGNHKYNTGGFGSFQNPVNQSNSTTGAPGF